MLEENDPKVDNIIVEPIDEDIKDKDEVDKTNPWRKPISYITWGLILSYFNLNFLLLQYILPIIGVAFIYLGLRSLRKENKFFTVAWALSIFEMMIRAVSLIAMSTPWFGDIKNSIVIGWFKIVFQITILLFLRSGLKRVFNKADILPPRDPIIGITVWLFLVAIGATSPFANSWVFVIPLVIFFIIVIRSLYLIGDELGDTEYYMDSAPVKVSNKVVMCGYFLICFLLVFSCGVLVNHNNLESTEATAPIDNNTRNMLLGLGFPKEILADISDENIDMLQDAIHVDVYTDLLMFDGRKESVEVSTNRYKERTKAGNRTIEATTVYTELPDNNLYVLVYFKWQKSKAYWNDGFTIWGGNEYEFELLDGALMYQKKGIDYIAAIPRLNNDIVTTNSMFFGKSQSKQITGGVCYPFGSKNQRGYVFYRLQLPKDYWSGCNCFNYLHSKSPITLPYSYAEQQIMSGTRSYLQHYTSFELQAYRDAYPK